MKKPDFDKLAKELMQSNEDELDNDSASVDPYLLQRLEIRFYKMGMEALWENQFGKLEALTQQITALHEKVRTYWHYRGNASRSAEEEIKFLENHSKEINSNWTEEYGILAVELKKTKKDRDHNIKRAIEIAKERDSLINALEQIDNATDLNDSGKAIDEISKIITDYLYHKKYQRNE